MINRQIDLTQKIQKGKVLIIYGARQVGKTTLIKSFLEKTDFKYRFDTGDNFQIAEELSKCTYESTDNFVQNYQLVVIDEAQKIPNIGNALKLMVDRHPDKYFIATGSSSFELAYKTGESLTGRKHIINMGPVSQYELSKELAPFDLRTKLNSFLIFGSYPEIVTAEFAKQKEELITSIAFSYLIKDILEFDRIRNSSTIMKLLKLIAFQLGTEVSTKELGTKIGVDIKTVQHYLDLLEKSFVIFRLDGFSRNLRKEVTKMSKYYFYDNGIRNALVSNFNQIEDRNDIGLLWENFLMSERIKRNRYHNVSTNMYFWRTWDQKEIDLVEEHSGHLDGFEFKWANKKTKAPKLWSETYEEATYLEVNQDNYLAFIT